MKKRYLLKNSLLLSALIVLVVVASCKKDSKTSNTDTTPTVATPTKLALIESDSSVYKLLSINITNIGTQAYEDELVFDTGSGGVVIDAEGILPASMIGKSGFNFTGDSTVIDGITITNQKSTVSYGADDATTDNVYGNLAYANITIGDQNGTVTVKRLPFFLYYKAVDANNDPLPAHEFDVFGVSPQYDITFPNNAYITSPFATYDPGNGLTKGFKIAALGTSNFTYEGNSVAGVLTLGLTASDLSSSSGFVMNALSYYSGYGYVPVISSTVTYNGKTFTTDAVFDTGTTGYNYLEDPTAADTLATLPLKSTVSVSTTPGFSYAFTVTDSDNSTYVENPKSAGGEATIFCSEFFLNNEYMLNFANHEIGLKNN